MIEHERPIVAVDIIIFTVIDDELKVLLVKRDEEPFRDSWAMVGGFVRIDEGLEDATKRLLKDKAGVDDVYLEQLYTFGDVDRDPRGRVVTVAYFTLIPSRTSFNGNDRTQWFSAFDLPALAFDHDAIITMAIQRLQWKIEYNTIVFTLLPEEFTMLQLRLVYEAILNKKLDHRNFSKKIIKHKIIELSGNETTEYRTRPSRLYKFTKNIGDIVNLF